MDYTAADVEQKKQEQAQAVAGVENALAAIEARGSQLDEWERTQLGRAIDLLRRGAYEEASRLAKDAMTPAAERSQNISSAPMFDGCGLHTFKAALEDARHQPLRPSPDMLLPLPPFQLQPEK
jgi:hypothetical protein